jgi:hypothetical protein
MRVQEGRYGSRPIHHSPEQAGSPCRLHERDTRRRNTNSRKARAVVSMQPLHSALILIDITGAKISRESVTHAKEITALDRPYVKRAALVGVESLPNAFYEAITRFSQRDFPRFNTREEALDWLVAEERLAAS